MQKYILVLAYIVFIGNITGQTKHDGFSPCTCSSCHHSTNETATLKGTIKDEKTGESLPFASIAFVDEALNRKMIVADLDGSYLLENIQPGTYQMTTSSVGYKPIQHTITIPSGSVIMNNILMEGGKIITCGFIKRDVKEIPEIGGLPEISLTTDESSQGPVTGLEGHNFIEDPAIIYPNPVKDIMNVKSTDPITVIEILGINGQVELEMDPRSSSPLDVSGLAAGTYYVRIHFENIKDVQVEKILIVK
jgi:hypothetical protein